MRPEDTLRASRSLDTGQALPPPETSDPVRDDEAYGVARRSSTLFTRGQINACISTDEGNGGARGSSN